MHCIYILGGLGIDSSNNLVLRGVGTETERLGKCRCRPYVLITFSSQNQMKYGVSINI
jgi:hypothetical protein